MTKALLKNTFREILKTKARFFSIMAIIALGVGFFAGIKATSPSMYRLAETYYHDSRLMDFRLVSTTGFTDEDVKAVEALDGVESVMPSYFIDVLTSAEDGGDVVRIIAVPKAYGDNEELNTLHLTEGRTPQKSGEIITEGIAFANARRKIGAKVTLNPVAGDNRLGDILKTTEFTIVGKTESPLYISYQRGTTKIGDGRIDEYMYISADDFKTPQYSELYVKADFSDGVSAFSDEYKNKAEEMKEKLEKLAREREAAFNVELQKQQAAQAANNKQPGGSAQTAAAGSVPVTPSAWFVYTRDDNVGYPTYDQNADRLDAVASVFPLFFLLVAVLVCVTTMTRLIEERRTETATLKALGYGNASIVLKYVIYSTIAAVAGSAVGVAIGLFTLPFIIYNAYKIMFYIGNITLVPHMPSIILGTLAAVLCTSAVSVIVCLKSLKVKPAQGMRPKAPKPGKRILLERITPLWRHMGFTAKLTARNLFRYKVRLCMTVIGVAGCTALIVTAFGIKNSFDPLTHEQFSTIFKYDTAVIPRVPGSAEELHYLKDVAGDTGTVEASMLAFQEEVTVEFGSRKTKESTYLSVMEDPDGFDELISLHTRKGKKHLELSDDAVMLNEKLASDFGISEGDTIKLSSESGTAEIKVAGIYEQYIHNYVFMTPTCYKNLFDKELSFNIYQVRLIDKSEETGNKFSEAMLADDRVTAVAFMDQNIDDFRNMLNSLDMVVVVMIVCAAALAFVVLYNLTNINLAERQREIATFKVLGFYNRETSRFIYIENIVLTVLGIGAGLGLGVLLTGFIIRTVEIDNVMFGRDIYLTSYLYAAGLTLLFSLLVNAMMSFKIKAVNMVESLKSVE